MTAYSTGITTTQEASPTQVSTQVVPADAVKISGNGMRSIVVEAAEMQAAMQPWVVMECYQLGRGRRLGQMDSLDLGSQQVVREHQDVAVQKMGVTPPNLCTVSCCTTDPTFRFSELCTSDADTLFFIPGNTEYDIYAPAGVRTTYVSFKQDEFLSGARALNPTAWERTPAQLLSIHTSRQVTFYHLVNQFLTETEKLAAMGNPVDPSVMRDTILQSILLIAAASRPDDSPPSTIERARSLYICRMARAFIEECLVADVVPSIVDICTAAGVSERTLQYAFRTYVDMSPLAYLRMCRLNRVRIMLRVSDPKCTTVTAIAMRYGFLHLGRFASDYKQVFDEHPSATLAS